MVVVLWLTRAVWSESLKAITLEKYTGEWNKYGSLKISTAGFNKNSQALKNIAVHPVFNPIWKDAKNLALTAEYKLKGKNELDVSSHAVYTAAGST